MAANLHTKPIDSGCESAKNWLLPSTSSIAIVISTQPISSYSVFYHPTKNRRLSRPRHCSKGAQAMPRLYVASFVVNTTVCRTFVFSHCSQMHQPLGNCDLLVLAHPGSPGQRAVKCVCVCVCVCARARARACVRVCVWAKVHGNEVPGTTTCKMFWDQIWQCQPFQ